MILLHKQRDKEVGKKPPRVFYVLKSDPILTIYVSLLQGNGCLYCEHVDIHFKVKNILRMTEF